MKQVIVIAYSYGGEAYPYIFTHLGRYPLIKRTVIMNQHLIPQHLQCKGIEYKHLLCAKSIQQIIVSHHRSYTRNICITNADGRKVYWQQAFVNFIVKKLSPTNKGVRHHLLPSNEETIIQLNPSRRLHRIQETLQAREKSLLITNQVRIISKKKVAILIERTSHSFK